MATQLTEASGVHRRLFMSVRRIATAALLTATVAGCGGQQGAPAGGADKGAPASVPMAPDTDVRTAILLPAQGRDLILEEMRGMLASVQGSVAAAATGDKAGMLAAAQASGVATARDLDPAMEQRLPPEFVRLGMSTHVAWDSLAADISRGVPADKALGQLGAILSNCVACHAQFRINLQR